MVVITMSMEGERAVECTMMQLAADLVTTLHIDGDFKHALLLTHEFIRAVSALLTLRRMRSDGLVLPLRR